MWAGRACGCPQALAERPTLAATPHQPLTEPQTNARRTLRWRWPAAPRCGARRAAGPTSRPATAPPLTGAPFAAGSPGDASGDAAGSLQVDRAGPGRWQGRQPYWRAHAAAGPDPRGPATAERARLATAGRPHWGAPRRARAAHRALRRAALAFLYLHGPPKDIRARGQTRSTGLSSRLFPPSSNKPPVAAAAFVPRAPRTCGVVLAPAPAARPGFPRPRGALPRTPTPFLGF